MNFFFQQPKKPLGKITVTVGRRIFSKGIYTERDS